MNQKTIERLIELRKANNYSQEELADKIGVSRQAVSKWERGEASPDTDNLIELAKLYNVSLDELVGITTANRETTNDTENAKTDEKADDTEFFENEDKSTSGRKRVEINDDGIFVDKDTASIKIDDSGIHITSKDKNGKEIHVGDYKHLKINHAKQKKGYSIANCVYITLVCIFVFLWGTLWQGWKYSWLLFLTIPIFSSILSCIKHKKVEKFAYPVLATFIYLSIGLFYGIWLPTLALFIFIPAFYEIAKLIDRRHTTVENIDIDLSDDDDDDDDDEDDDDDDDDDDDED